MGNTTDQRRGGMRALAANLPKIAGPILGKRGLGEARLLTEWAAIVGPDLADHACAERLSFVRGERVDGTLRLRVASAAAIEVQHRAPLIIERINAALGYKAVARLAIVQGPLPAPAAVRPPPPRPLVAAEDQRLAGQLESIGDPELRDALDRLGRAVIGSAGPKGTRN